MAKNELSAKLMDALMVGNQEEADKIQKQINEQHKTRLKSSFPVKASKSESVIKTNTVLNDDDSTAVELYDFLNKKFGSDWWEWEIETIEQALWQDYGIALSEVNNDKILAIRHLCRSANAFDDWYEFNQLALAFGGAIADFTHFRKPSPGMIISAVKTMNYIRPDESSNFGDEVKDYISVSLIDDGIYTPPPSIVRIIKDNMGRLVSDSSKGRWQKVYSAMADTVSNGTTNETIEGIQSRRLVKSEASALNLYKRS